MHKPQLLHQPARLTIAAYRAHLLRIGGAMMQTFPSTLKDMSGQSVTTLQIALNGQVVHLPCGTTLASLLEQQQLDPQRHATAVNGQFVARDQRADCVLQQGDAVMCFQAIVGG